MSVGTEEIIEEYGIKCLSIREISKKILEKMRYNHEYLCVFEVENKLREKGVSQKETDELMVRKLASLILNLNSNNMHIPKYWVYKEFDKIYDNIDFSKQFKSNERTYRIKVRPFATFGG